MNTKSTLRRLAFTALLLAAGNFQRSTAHAQATAFSYQGRLNDASGLANGTYDLTFTLFNTNAGGTLISGPVTNSAVSVSNGLFTVAVDFGGVPFTLGQSLWLEIDARTNGTATFSTLAPRQAVLSTPIADYALAVNSSSLIGQVTDANLATTFTSPHSFNNAGNSFTGNGSGLTALNAASLATGTVSDLRLSPNVALLNSNQTFTGSNNFSAAGILGTNTLHFGVGVAGQEANAGKIGYEVFSPDALDIVGASTVGNPRKIQFWAEAGANFNGSVGIGTNNPQVRLQIVGAGNSDDARLMVQTTGGTFGPQIRLNRSGTGGDEWVFVNDGTANGPVNALQLVQASSGSRMTFATNGNVGIGTSTPKHKLDVDGNIFLGTAFNGQDFTELGDTLYLGASRKYLSSTLGAPINGSPDWINLMCHPLSHGILFGTAGPSDADPHSAPNPLMVIQSGGNVGIGTTTPTSQLTVNNSGSPAISLIGSGTNGQVDIGIASFATAYSVSAAANDAVIRQSGKGKLFLQTGSGTAAITITTNNNVGIGTSTPTNTLQVNGTMAASALRAPGAGVNTGTFAFIQRAVATNTTGDQTFIFNPVCDGDPKAILIVTHNWSADTNSTSQYNTKPVGVYYTGANWAIFNEDTSAMALGRAFNVMVIKP